MSVDNPQKRPGTTHIEEDVSNDKGSPHQSPIPDDGSGTSSHHTGFTPENVSESKGNQVIEGQKLRGYVHDDSRGTGAAATDATVAPDGTRRVKEISGP